jgi:hypothetical protein
MIQILESLDRRTALGLLARTALALESDNNPAAIPVLDGEVDLRTKLLSVARERVGVSPGDDSEDALDRIGAFLDREAEDLVGPTDTEAALRRLAESGNLPSDMYEVAFNPKSLEWAIEQNLERDLAMATIRRPDKQQHFGPSSDLKSPSLVSLFIRYFRTKWPFKDFHLLVVANRDGLVLNVGQVWRIYPSLLDVSDCHNLVKVLERFANSYGAPITVGGKVGNFFLITEHSVPSTVRFTPEVGRVNVGISQLTQATRGVATSALVVAINLIKYHDIIHKMQVERSEIFDSLITTEDQTRSAS